MSDYNTGLDTGSETDEFPRNEARIEVLFKDEDLEAWGSFYPPADGSGISRAIFDSVLLKHRLFNGYDREAAEEAFRQCRDENRVVTEVLLARGEAPVREIGEYLRLNPLYAPKQQGEFSEISMPVNNFTVVKKGQILAKIESLKPGKDGVNVHGEPIPFKKIRPKGVKAGTNTRMEENFLKAEISGQLILDGNVINIVSDLEIKGELSRRNGNIIFPGNLYIEGPVNDGLKIHSGGSIIVKQQLEAGHIVSKGDLSAAGGISGRAGAQVKTGGNLKTSSIENCRVACRKKVTVKKDIINSSIFCLDTVDISNGRILGGEIWAVNGVKAGALSKISGRCPKIHCGIDFTSEQEKEKCNNRFRILSAKLAKVKNLLSDPSLSSEKKARLEKLRASLAEDQKETSMAISELMSSITTNNEATVEVYGEVAAGTLIEICDIALFVERTLNYVKIRLDRNNNKLVVDRY